MELKFPRNTHDSLPINSCKEIGTVGLLKELMFSPTTAVSCVFDEFFESFR